MNISEIHLPLSKVAKLSSDLARSAKRPSSRTLTLIDKALAYLVPFESPLAATASRAERDDLLLLLRQHRDILCPYLDPDVIETNLRLCR